VLLRLIASDVTELRLRIGRMPNQRGFGIRNPEKLYKRMEHVPDRNIGTRNKHVTVASRAVEPEPEI